MIRITPRNPPPNCTASPGRLTLPGTVTVGFSAQSSEAEGEDVVVTYDLGEGSDVLITNGGASATRLRVSRAVGSGSTAINQALDLAARPGRAPDGDLRIQVVIASTPGTSRDQCLTHVEII